MSSISPPPEDETPEFIPGNLHARRVEELMYAPLSKDEWKFIEEFEKTYSVTVTISPDNQIVQKEEPDGEFRTVQLPKDRYPNYLLMKAKYEALHEKLKKDQETGASPIVPADQERAGFLAELKAERTESNNSSPFVDELRDMQRESLARYMESDDGQEWQRQIAKRREAPKQSGSLPEASK